MNDYYISASEEHIKKEKNKAQELRRSQWWKNRRGTGTCHYCNGRFNPKELTMDHVVPLVRGGRSVKSNLVPCCTDCNSKKRDLIPVEWSAYLAQLSQQ